MYLRALICFKTQLEKQLHTDQELKKRVLRLDFFMQEARSQTRKLKRVNTDSFL